MKQPVIHLTLRVVTRNPKLQTANVRKSVGVFYASRIVGAIPIPEPAEGEPITLVHTDAGPLDVYETAEEVFKRLDEAK